MDFSSQLVQAVGAAYTWGSAVLVGAAALMMVASLIGWLLHRS